MSRGLTPHHVGKVPRKQSPLVEMASRNGWTMWNRLWSQHFLGCHISPARVLRLQRSGDLPAHTATLFVDSGLPPGWALSDLAPCPEDLRKCKPLTMSFSSFPKPQHLSVLDIPGLPPSIHFPFSHTPTLTMWFRRGVGLKSLQVPRAGPDWLTSPAWLHRLQVTGSGMDT